jgi:hypothetical protein
MQTFSHTAQAQAVFVERLPHTSWIYPGLATFSMSSETDTTSCHLS